jgi:hypothetical protein
MTFPFATTFGCGIPAMRNTQTVFAAPRRQTFDMENSPLDV